jgi:hypothetical protein
MLHDLYANSCVKVPNSGATSNMGRVRLGPESAFPLIGLTPETPSSSRVHRFQTRCRLPVLIWPNYRFADQLDTSERMPINLQKEVGRPGPFPNHFAPARGTF